MAETTIAVPFEKPEESKKAPGPTPVVAGGRDLFVQRQRCEYADDEVGLVPQEPVANADGVQVAPGVGAAARPEFYIPPAARGVSDRRPGAETPAIVNVGSTSVVFSRSAPAISNADNYVPPPVAGAGVWPPLVSGPVSNEPPQIAHQGRVINVDNDVRLGAGAPQAPLAAGAGDIYVTPAGRAPVAVGNREVYMPQTQQRDQPTPPWIFEYYPPRTPPKTPVNTSTEVFCPPPPRRP